MKQFKMNERQRFSIRKFSIGAASVLLGSVFFVANPATEVQAAEANTEVVSQDGNGNTGNPSVLPPSDTSNQNLNVEQEGAKPNTQATERKEQDSQAKDGEGKAEETVENKGDEKVDGVVKPVSGESSPVSEVEKDKKEAQPELEEKSLTDKEEAVVADKTEQSQEEDGYQLYDKLIDASKRLKESNPESAVAFKNLADTINEKLGLSDDGKISGELVEKAHKLLDGNQVMMSKNDSEENSEERGVHVRKRRNITGLTIGRWNAVRKQIEVSNILVVPGGDRVFGNILKISAKSNHEKITSISVTGHENMGLKVASSVNGSEASLTFDGTTPRSGQYLLNVTVTTSSGSQTTQFGYYLPFQKPTINTPNDSTDASVPSLAGKANEKPNIDVTIPYVPKLPNGAKMKVYLVTGGSDISNYGGSPDGLAYPEGYNILASKDISPNNDGDGSARKITITQSDYKPGVNKIGTDKFRALTVIEVNNNVNDGNPRERGSWFSDERRATAPVVKEATPEKPTVASSEANANVTVTPSANADHVE
ncbi:YSIRK-type signal peptide-containing protein, partial [Streptococcus sp. 3851]